MTKHTAPLRPIDRAPDTGDDQELLRAVIDSMEQGILVWSKDALCLLHNERIFNVLELSREQIFLGCRRSDFLAAAAARREVSQPKVDEVQDLFEKGAPFAFDRAMPSGRTVATNARPLRGGGFVVTFTDVTDERRSAKELKQAKHQAETAELKALKTLAKEQVWRNEAKLLADLDEWLQSCKSLVELYDIVSVFMERLLPDTIGELYVYSNSRDVLDGACHWGKAQLHDHIAPDSCWALRRGRRYRFDADEVSFTCNHVKDQSAQKDVTDTLCVPIVAHGDTVGLLHIKFDPETPKSAIENSFTFAMQCAEHISLAIANVKLRDELHDQSTRDPLTGLYNRRYFLEAMRSELSMATRKEGSLGILSFDADKFKSFNDNHGHDAGDMVLRAIGEKLRELFNSGEIPCRFGGEEFTVLIPGADLDATEKAAEALRLAVEEIKIRYGSGLLPRVTISVGVSAFPDNGTMPQDLLNAADEALYEAKDAGRNCVRTARIERE